MTKGWKNMHVRKYYRRSWWMRLLAPAILLCTVGCAGANGAARDAPRLSFAHLNKESKGQEKASIDLRLGIRK